MTDDVRDAINELTERVEQLETELEQEREARREAEERVEQLEETVGHLMDDVIEVENDVADVRESIEATASVENSNAVDPEEDQTPLEQIVALPEPVADDHLNNAQHRNTWRAREIVRGWSNYAERFPSGTGLRSKDARTVLSTLEGDEVRDTNTVKRVFHRIEELSHGAFTARKNSGGRWVVVLDEPEKLADADAVVSGRR